MADELTLEVEGIEQLVATFGRYFSDIDTSPIILNAIEKIGKNIQARAIDLLSEKIYNTPEGWYLRTGLLKSNMSVDSPKHTTSETSTFVRAKQDYAVYVEMGTGVYSSSGEGRKTPWVYKAQDKFHRTVGMKPRAFLLPAGQIEMEQATKIMEEALTEFLQTKITL